MNKRVETIAAGWPSVGKFRFWLECGLSVPSLPRTFAYHYGMLSRDRGQTVETDTISVLGGVKWVPCPEIEEMAEMAWSAYERGEVVLAQRKHADMWYEYLAIRR